MSMTDGQAVMLAASVGVATVMLAGSAWGWLGQYVSDRREHAQRLHAAALRRHPAGLDNGPPRPYGRGVSDEAARYLDARTNRRGVEVWGAER